MRVINHLITILLIMMLTACGTMLPNDERANLTGAVDTGPMERMPPLTERGVHKIAIMVHETTKIVFVHVGVTIFGNEQYEIDRSTLIPAGYLDSLFVTDLAKNREISIIDDSQQADVFINGIKKSFWSGEYSVNPGSSADAILKKLATQGVDVVMVVQEPYMEFDYVSNPSTTVGVGGEGICDCRGVGVNANASFEVTLISTRNGKQLENGGYKQGSNAPVAGLQWRKAYDQYTPAEVDMIKDGIEMRDQNNVMQALYLLKILPRPQR